MTDAQSDGGERNVLEFDHGVRAYPPVNAGGYWRIRWEERRKRKDTTAPNRTAAIAKAQELVERLARSAPTELGRATGAHLVAHYLDPGRRPPRVKEWSIRHRDEQTRYCNLYVSPVIGDLLCRELTRDDFQLILDKAPTASVAQHIRRCLTGIVAAGLEEGHLLGRQDLMRGVRWHGVDHRADLDRDSVDRVVTDAEIPTVVAVHALARRTAERSGVWWRELQILLIASPVSGGASTSRSENIKLTSSVEGSRSTARASRPDRHWWRACQRADAGESRCSPRSHWPGSTSVRWSLDVSVRSSPAA